MILKYFPDLVTEQRKLSLFKMSNFGQIFSGINFIYRCFRFGRVNGFLILTLKNGEIVKMRMPATAFREKRWNQGIKGFS